MPAATRTFLLAIAAIIGATLPATGSSPVPGEGPWCALVASGRSVKQTCHFKDFESCRAEIQGGNRGFCNHNPRWTGPVADGQPVRRKAKRKHRRR